MQQATPELSGRLGAPEVLVVGAGPTGLTLACELTRRDVPCRVLDAGPGPQRGSRGKGVQPRTLEVFDDLGVGERVLANGRMAMPLEMAGPDGQVRRGGAVPETLRNRPDIPYPASVVTPQWRVEQALRERLTALGGAVEFGTVLEDFEQTDNAVTARLIAGGTSETVTAGWLVGCDGGHSAVRAQAGIAFVGETLDEVRMIVADLTVEGLDREAWHIWRPEEGMVSLCPLPSTDEFQYQASIAAGQDPGLDPANMQAILDRRSGRSDLRLAEPSWSSLWRANIRLVDHYRQDRVFLAGDAAHIHSPAGGQGMNTGIQDGANLGWKLAAVVGGASPTLLDSYEAERRPVAAHVLELSNQRLAEAVTHHSVPIRRDTSTIQLDITYRGSTLARDDRDDTAALRAGDRAPDATDLATTSGVHRLFDLTRGGRFTLLSFGAAPALDTVRCRSLRVVDEVSGPDDLVDSHGHLAEAYQAVEGTLVLIRPDGYIGVISDAGDPRAVTEYLTTIAE